MTGVTMSTRPSELTMPPRTGVASGFITSAPVEWLHMIGRRLATTVDTVITFGRSRSRAPSLTASSSPPRLSRGLVDLTRLPAPERILVLAAPLDVRALRELHGVGDDPSRLVDEAPDVPAANVQQHGHDEQPVLARDHRRPGDSPDLGKL